MNRVRSWEQPFKCVTLRTFQADILNKLRTLSSAQNIEILIKKENNELVFELLSGFFIVILSTFSRHRNRYFLHFKWFPGRTPRSIHTRGSFKTQQFISNLNFYSVAFLKAYLKQLRQSQSNTESDSGSLTVELRGKPTNIIS